MSDAIDALLWTFSAPVKARIPTAYTVDDLTHEWRVLAMQDVTPPVHGEPKRLLAWEYIMPPDTIYAAREAGVLSTAIRRRDHWLELVGRRP